MSRSPICSPRTVPLVSLAACARLCWKLLSSTALRMLELPIIRVAIMPAISMMPSVDVTMSFVPMLKLLNRSIFSSPSGFGAGFRSGENAIVSGVSIAAWIRPKPASSISDRGGGVCSVRGGELLGKQVGQIDQRDHGAVDSDQAREEIDARGARDLRDRLNLGGLEGENVEDPIGQEADQPRLHLHHDHDVEGGSLGLAL